jgi:hypothetical protein
MEIQQPDEKAPVNAEKEEKDTGTNIGCLAVLMANVALCAWTIWMITPDSIKYGAIYFVGKDHVQVEDKPTDCDWGHAPLGNKGCHYEKVVNPGRNEKGEVTYVWVNWEKLTD